MSVIYRPARSTDLEPAARLVQQAINDLKVRHGFAPTAPLRPPFFQNFCLTVGADGLWVAEESGAMIGFGFSWVCQEFWYLAQLFVAPDAQAKGIGQTLLAHTLQQAQRQATRNKALITFAYNVSSTGLYVRHGLYTREPLYVVAAPASLVAQEITGGDYDARPREHSTDVTGWIGRIDEEILGYRRDAHHELLFRTDPGGAMQIAHAGRPVGYCYISKVGHIGPLALAPVADGREAVRAALHRALQYQPQSLSMIVPGSSDILMGAVMDFGFRISDSLVLMAERPFGNWRQYMPRDPGYM